MSEVVDNQAMQLRTEFERVSRRTFVTRAAALAGAAVVTTYPGPASAAPVDLRNMDNPAAPGTKINYITPVKHQSSCNSCTAFAVVAAVEGTYNKAKNLPGNASDAVNLSEGQLFFAAGPIAKCETTHWWPEDALDYCAQVGLVREDLKEFVIPPRSKTIQISGAATLLRPTLAKTQDAIKNWIGTKGPVVAVMAEYNDFFLFDGGNTAYYPGVNFPSKPAKLWFVGGHVVAIVGYDDGQNYWICKNSYGGAWNGTGYINIAYGGQANQADCLIDSIDVWGVSL